MKNSTRIKKILPGLVPFLGLLLMLAIFMVTTQGRLLEGKNLRNIINQVFPLIVTGMGALFVYGQGMVDISVGAAVGCCTLVCARVIGMTNVIPLGLLAAIVAGLVITWLNGVITNYLHVEFIMTSLFLMFVCRGILTLGTLSPVSAGIDLDRYDIYNLFGTRLAVIVVIALVMAYILNYTKTGKYIRAIGSNPVTGEQAGIRVTRYRIRGYLLLGITMGIAAFFILTREGTVTKSTASGMEMDIMIALLLGGMPQGGGTGTRLRSAILGSLTYVILRNGLILSNVDVNLVSMIRGILFIAVVAVSVNRKVRVLPR